MKLAIPLPLVVATFAHAGQPPTYTIQNIGPSSGFTTQTQGPGINNLGQVTFGDWTGAYVWNNGTTSLLPQSSGGVGREINDFGTVAGFTNAGAALWTNGNYQSLGPFLPGSDMSSMSMAVNNAGHAIAWSTQSNGTTRSFFFNGISAIDLGGTGNYTYAYDINDSDQVVGFYHIPGTGARPFRWHSSTGLVNLGSPTQQGAFAYGINNAGTIVGAYESSVFGIDQSAFRYATGQYTLLEHLAGANKNHALAINERNLIVGYADMTAGGRQALAWQNDQVTLLSQLVTGGSGWTLEIATDVNDSGQIVGMGRLNGVDRMFLLTPIPCPGGMALLILGLGTRRTRRR